jgi:hypothetical protein
MAVTINGDGTIAGISVGGLPDGVVDSGTLATNSVNSAELIDGAVDNSHLATGIDVTKLADGTITNSELQYINTLSSNAQTQISAAGGGDVYFGGSVWNASTTGTLAITGVGFQPDSVLFFATMSSEYSFSIGGQYNNGSEIIHYTQTHHAADRWTNSTSYAMYLYDGTTSNDAYVVITSLDAGGFTITRSKSGTPTADIYFSYLCLKTG